MVLDRQGRAIADPVAVPATVAPHAFQRLHALVRKGYTTNIGSDERTDVVVLKHVGRAPDLILRPDGVVEQFDGRRPRYKKSVELEAIPVGSASDELRFLQFTDSIPPPSFRDRTRRWRHKYVYFPAVILALAALCVTISVFVFNINVS
jgi:hypothetical protein